MSLTIAPADEACRRLTDFLKSNPVPLPSLKSTRGDLPYQRTFLKICSSRTQIDVLEELEDSMGSVRLDLVIMTETQLAEQLDMGDNSSHVIEVIVRKKINDMDSDVPELALFMRNLYLALRNFISPDNRVQVWECDHDEKENPEKTLLNEVRLFLSKIALRVEVQQ